MRPVEGQNAEDAEVERQHQRNARPTEHLERRRVYCAAHARRRRRRRSQPPRSTRSSPARATSGSTSRSTWPATRSCSSSCSSPWRAVRRRRAGRVSRRCSLAAVVFRLIAAAAPAESVRRRLPLRLGRPRAGRGPSSLQVRAGRSRARSELRDADGLPEDQPPGDPDDLSAARRVALRRAGSGCSLGVTGFKIAFALIDVGVIWALLGACCERCGCRATASSSTRGIRSR